jgi:nucleotide-binding universal stress UspA family protein
MIAAMFRSIVVGTDGSDTARKAVDQAIDLAKSVGASVYVVSAYEPVSQARLREEAKQTPADLQWMVNPREEVDATLATPTSSWSATRA